MVVDNGSGDGSVAYLEREGVPHVSLLENIGFAAAVNLGVARTRAEAVLALNADTVLEPGCLALLLDALEADPKLGGVQPRLLQLEGGAGPPLTPRPLVSTAPARRSPLTAARSSSARGRRSRRGSRTCTRSSASAAPPACCGASFH